MKFTRFFVSRPARGKRKEENIYTHIYSKALRFNPYKYVLLPSTCFVLPPLLSTPFSRLVKPRSKDDDCTETFQRFTLAAASWIRRPAVGC